MNKLILILIIFLSMLASRCFAAELPVFEKIEIRPTSANDGVYIQWKQPDKKDYGYIVTAKEEGGEEKILVELDPSPVGNKDLTQGGVIFIKSGLTPEKPYVFSIYPFNRNGTDDLTALVGKGPKIQTEPITIKDPATRSTTASTAASAAAGASGPATGTTGVGGASGTSGTSSPTGTTGVGGASGTSGGSATGIHLSSNFGDMFKKVYNFAIGLASIILCVLLLVGGIMYLTAAGNDESSKKARNLIVDAVVGFVILLIIYSAGKFVIKKLEIPVPSDSPIAMNLSDNIIN